MLEVNKQGFGKVKEDETVASALRELMAPEIEKEVEEAVQKAVEKALQKASQETQKAILETEQRTAQETLKTVGETEQKTEQKTQEQTAIVALENGLEESLIRKLAPSISEERLRILRQQVAEKKGSQ